MIVTGEASGDQHGAMLVSAMRRRDPALSFCGIGGRALRAEGVKIVVEASTLSVVGITEVAAKIPTLFKALNTAKQLLKQWRPALLILIDFPDFNLNVAARAKKLGIPVLYYISPQLWAWRSGRIRKIGKRVDHMAVILPFEEAFYRKHGVSATFVGHPLIDAVSDSAPPDADFRNRISALPTIGLLPGSRDKEVLRHLPVMLTAAGMLQERFGPLRFIVSGASSVEKSMVQDLLRSGDPVESMTLSTDPVRKLFRQTDLVVAASGTVTLEAAIAGTPMVVIYRVSPLSYRLARALVHVRHVGLANLIAGREVVPELIQNDATPEKITRTVGEMLKNGNRLEQMRREMRMVRKRLGEPGVSRRVADIAMEMIG